MWQLLMLLAIPTGHILGVLRSLKQQLSKLSGHSAVWVKALLRFLHVCHLEAMLHRCTSVP